MPARELREQGEGAMFVVGRSGGQERSVRKNRNGMCKDRMPTGLARGPRALFSMLTDADGAGAFTWHLNCSLSKAGLPLRSVWEMPAETRLESTAHRK